MIKILKSIRFGGRGSPLAGSPGSSHQFYVGVNYAVKNALAAKTPVFAEQLSKGISLELPASRCKHRSDSMATGDVERL